MQIIERLLLVVSLFTFLLLFLTQSETATRTINDHNIAGFDVAVGPIYPIAQRPLSKRSIPFILSIKIIQFLKLNIFSFAQLLTVHTKLNVYEK